MNTTATALEKKESILEIENLLLENQNVEIPFPDSDFYERTDGTEQPFSWVGKLNMTYRSGATAFGTGTLIARRWVLTAAHNVANTTDGQVTSATFSPGETRTGRPEGTINVRRIIYLKAYEDHMPPNPGDTNPDFTSYLYDYAVLELERDVYTVNNLLPFVATNAQLDHRLVNSIIGYPGHKPLGTMWYASGMMQRQVGDHEPILFYKTSTNPGDSGAAITMEIEGVRRIVGVHVAGSAEIESNYGVRITQDVYDNIQEWMAM